MTSQSFDSVPKEWPKDMLESIDVCPVCGSIDVKSLEEGLLDFMSKPVSGPWSINACQACGVGYLAPRPDRESIGEAYRHYYTHSSEKDDLVHSCFRSIRSFLAEKYYATASGYGNFTDRSVYLLVKLLFPLSLYFDAKSRHIFSLKKQPGKLLDIGCGNGQFLKFADRFGWRVVGVDFDAEAVREARSCGLDVRLGDIGVIDSGERYDFITLSHVIEHVYDPVELLRSCYGLLNDGGVLWLETPNIESMGYAYYKSSWRGLEPPRHIMLFNIKTLNEMFLKAGFQRAEQKNHGLSGVYMGLSSERILSKSEPCGSWLKCIVRTIFKLPRVLSLEIVQLLSKRRREFLTVSATR
jgi:2-polyprenyl-3-methyl-5-hydroxy-6-metoxy-1,4-benzoquinol methylase